MKQIESGSDSGAGVTIADIDALLDDLESALERDLASALTLGPRAIAEASAHGTLDQEGKAHHVYGWARFMSGDMLGALSDQLAAIDRFAASGNETGFGRCLHALGAAYETAGDPSAAIEHFEQAIAIQTRIGDRWGEARTRNGLAITMASAEGYEGAVSAFRDVAERFEEIGDRWWALMVDTNRCSAQLDLVQSGTMDQADGAELCRQTLGECDELVLAAHALGASGQSIELRARECRARALLALGRPQKSLDEVNRTMLMARISGDVAVLIDLELHAVRALEALDRPDSVFSRLDRAEELARSAGRDSELLVSLELRAEVCEARGDLEGALAAHRGFHKLKTRAGREGEQMRAKVVRSLLAIQKAEHELELAQAEVDKLEALGRERRRMVSVIAHELRNPITTVLGLSSEMARNWRDLGDEGEQLIAMIRDEAEDIAEIVEDLLATESIAQGSLRVEVERRDLAEMARDVIAKAQLDGKGGVVVGDAVGMVDPVRFRQILRNLVSNAVRYGGDRLAVEICQTADWAMVDVRDNGSGVPEDERDVIFEPYQRSGADTHGTRSVGLGLAVTRQLARLMGGDVVYSEADGDTVFRLTLPLEGHPVS